MNDFFEKVPVKDFLKNYPRPINQRPMRMHKSGVPNQYDEKKVLDCIDEKTEQGLTRIVSDASKKVAKNISFQDDLREIKRYLKDEDENIFKIFEFEGEVKNNCRPSIPDDIADDCFGCSIEDISQTLNFEEECKVDGYLKGGDLNVVDHTVCPSVDFRKNQYTGHDAHSEYDCYRNTTYIIPR